MNFLYDWFSHNIPVWEKVVVPNVPHGAAVLELGAFEGRATVWMAQNLSGSLITCVDTWEGSPEHAGIDMTVIRGNFQCNTAGLNLEPVFLGETTWALQMLHDDEIHFDLIYVDASHVARDVLADGLLAWRVLKPGGLLIFDDYEWLGGKDAQDRPKLGIDAFLSVLRPQEYTTLHRGYQIILKKI